MTRPRLAHLIAIPKRYTPAISTDISKTIRAERKRLAESDSVRTVRYSAEVAKILGGRA